LTPSPRHYALVDEARLLLLAAGDVPSACRCVTTLADSYHIDELQLHADTLAAIAGTFRARKFRLEVAMQRLALLRRLTAAGRTDLVLAQTRAATLARQTSGPMPKVYDELERSELARAFRGVAAARKARAARKTLEQEPTNPTANATLGAYLCLTKDSWIPGLDFLVRGGDTALARAARLDQRGADDHAGRVAIADAWWAIAAEQPRFAPAARLRAANWEARTQNRMTARIAEIRTKLVDEVTALGVAVAGPAGTLLQEAVVDLHAKNYPDLVTKPVCKVILEGSRPDDGDIPGEAWGDVVVRDATLSDEQRQIVAAKMTKFLDAKIPHARCHGDVIIMNVVGMWLADVPKPARGTANIPIKNTTDGTVLLSVAEDFGRKTATNQTPPVGSVFWMAGSTKIADLREFATGFVATADAARRGRDTVRVVYTYPVRQATMTDHFTFSKPDLEGIRKTLRQLEW